MISLMRVVVIPEFVMAKTKTSIGRHSRKGSGSTEQKDPTQGARHTPAGKSPRSPPREATPLTLSIAEKHVYWKGVFIQKFGAPPPAKWRGKGGTIALLMKECDVPKGSKAEVRAVVTRVYTAPKAGLNRRYNRTAARKIEYKTPTGNLMMGMVSRLGTEAAAQIVSEERAKAGLSTVSQSTIDRAMNRPEFEMKAAARGTRQQGSKEKHKDWLTASYEFAKQLKDQIARGKKKRGGRLNAAKADKNKPPAIRNDAILWIDEANKHCTMGGAGHGSASSKIERRFPVDPSTGAPLSATFGTLRCLLSSTLLSSTACP